MPSSELTDNELMQRLQQGDRQALDTLIDRWQKPIMAFIYRFILDYEWAQDLTQETFVKLYMHSDRFKTDRKFSSWIYAIAGNLCKNWLKWNKRRTLIDQPYFEDWQEANTLSIADKNAAEPSKQLLKDESNQQVIRAIESLPYALKTTVLLHYYQGLSYEDISESLGCSVRGVESRLYRARKQLKRKLKLRLLGDEAPES